MHILTIAVFELEAASPWHDHGQHSEQRSIEGQRVHSSLILVSQPSRHTMLYSNTQRSSRLPHSTLPLLTLEGDNGNEDKTTTWVTH